MPAMAQALRMVERMAAQNSQHDIVMDYKARSLGPWPGHAHAVLHVPSMPAAHILQSWLTLNPQPRLVAALNMQCRG